MTQLKLNIIGFKMNKVHPKFWTAEQDKFLIEHYSNVNNKELGLQLNRSTISVGERGAKLGLRKSEDLIRKMGLEVSKNPASIAARYKKGNVPVNAGKKIEDYMSPEAIENCKATQFKKGLIPHNAKYDGYERINVYGYIEVRVSSKKFVQKHRLVWEQHNGKIPAGTNIQFRDGNRQNCAIENLYAITRSDQLRENSIINYPPEARKVIRKIAKIKNILDKENNEKTN